MPRQAGPFEQTSEVDLIGLDGKTKETQIDLCWGKMKLEKVVTWEGPMKFDDYQAANVKYLYKVEGLAEWAKRPEIWAAFPDIGEIIEDAGKKELAQSVELTSAGWEANRPSY